MAIGYIKHYAVVFLGALIGACSVHLFLIPSHLYSGGVSGMAMIGYYLSGLPIGLQTLVYNLPLLVIAWKMLSRYYAIEAVIGTVLCSVCIDLTKFVGAYAPEVEPLLAAIYGGVLCGISSGLIFRVNGNTGGMDILAAIIKKNYSLNMGGVLFFINCLIMAAAMIVFDVRTAMYTLVSMYLSGKVIDTVVAGFDDRKAIIIISQRTEEIAEAIMKEVGRGVTFIEGEGAFFRKQQKIVLVVVSLRQIAGLKLIVNAFDKQAFMIIVDANEVAGKGFTLPNVKEERAIAAKAAEK